jgi:hypothetical protein
MIKTLRITTFIAAILAVGVLAFPVVYGYRGDEQIEKFLNSPGVIERFKQAKGAKRVKVGNQVSPLVKQAIGFGLYMNPPRTAVAPRPVRKPTVGKQVTPPPVDKIFTAKFDLIGTSYYASRPELSLAYINEPGKGLHWVRQGARVSHLLIQEVKDGSVIVKDRDKLVTLVAARAPKKSLLKSDKTTKSTSVMPGVSSSITSTASVQASMKPTLPKPGAAERAIAAKSAAAAAVPPRTVHPRAVRGAPEMSDAEQDAVLVDFINDLKAIQKGSDQSEEEKAALQEAIVDFEAMRITSEEARRLDRLGKELRDVQNDPERAKNMKIQKSGSPQPPPPPPKRPVPPRRPRPTRPPK